MGSVGAGVRVVKGEEVTEYYHMGVVCSLINDDLALPLDVEMLRPGACLAGRQEGEVAAAKRLLERVLRDYGRLIDAISGDAIYLEAPFFNFCLDHKKHVLATLKDNNPALLADAEGVFTLISPVSWQQPGRVVQCWDAEDFTTNPNMAKPIRVVHTEETITCRQRIAGQWVEANGVSNQWWATTIPQALLGPRHTARAGHRRWDIDDKLFNTLVNDWHVNHCFKHDLTAILNFILTLFIAFVLVQALYHRNLKPSVRAIFSTLISITAELHASLAATHVQAPWVHPHAPRPP